MAVLGDSIFGRAGGLPLGARVLGDAPAHAVDGEVRLSEEGGCTVLTVAGAGGGGGTMRFREVLPGVVVSFNDFRMERCVSGFRTSERVLCADYCLEGRIEQPMPGGALAYVAAGDLKLDDRTSHTGAFVLPTGRYRGVTVSFDLGRCGQTFERELGRLPAGPEALHARFCRDGRPLILHGGAGAGRVFEGLDDAPACLRDALCRVRVLELALFLQALDPAEEGRVPCPYYPRAQVERVKEARDLMVADLSRTVTVEGAARAVGMPLTAFKECFKGVYGASPASYLRRLRMERAADLLRTGNATVASVGVAVGYDSPSKFSAAFKAATGETPTAYRRRARG